MVAWVETKILWPNPTPNLCLVMVIKRCNLGLYGLTLGCMHVNLVKSKSIQTVIMSGLITHSSSSFTGHVMYSKPLRRVIGTHTMTHRPRGNPTMYSVPRVCFDAACDPFLSSHNIEWTLFLIARLVRFMGPSPAEKKRLYPHIVAASNCRKQEITVFFSVWMFAALRWVVPLSQRSKAQWMSCPLLSPPQLEWPANIQPFYGTSSY